MCCVSCVNTPYTAAILNHIISITQRRADTLVYNGYGDRYIAFTNTPDSEAFGSAYVMVGHLISKEEICIRLDEGILWQPNDTAASLSQHFTDRANYSLVVDGVQNNTIYWEDGLARLLTKDGRDYGSLDYCFATDQLAVGNHRVDLEIITTSGEPRHNIWDISIF